MNMLQKSKSEVRQQTSDALQQFLASGGSIELVKSRKQPKSTMSGKSSRGFTAGTSGFAVGYPSKSL